MIVKKKLLLICFCFIVYLNNICQAQESYFIKKRPDVEKKLNNKEKNTNLEDAKSINKKPEKKILEKEIDINSGSKIKKKKETKEKQNEEILIQDNEFRIIYRPKQESLSEKSLIKVIELSNRIKKDSFVTMVSYASKNNKQGTSDARRLSLSRALEVRRVFIENEFPATNISVRALGSSENKEGFTDIIIISVN